MKVIDLYHFLSPCDIQDLKSKNGPNYQFKDFLLLVHCTFNENVPGNGGEQLDRGRTCDHLFEYVIAVVVTVAVL